MKLPIHTPIFFRCPPLKSYNPGGDASDSSQKARSLFPAPPAGGRDSCPFWTAGIFFSALSVILTFCARTLPGFAQRYAVTVYPVLAGTLGRFCSLFPLSLSEAGLYILILFSLYYLCRNIKKPLRVLSRGFMICSCLLFLYTVNCGINYYRNPFSYEAGMVMEKSSTEDLYRLCAYLIDQINASIEPAEHTEGPLKGLYPGQTEDTPLPSPADLRAMGIAGQEAMEGLGEQFPQLKGFYPYPKPLMGPRLLSVQQLCGIYSPFTIEANYNREMPYYNIPHTICHELSHLKGFMREDEANFIGYMACIGSQSPDFRYSGYLMGWVYAGNALAKVDLEAYYELHSRLKPEAVKDLVWNNQFWDRFDGKVAEASNQLNDRYLKANSQEDGVRSYGRMVDLMLAYYKDRL
ncbi:MAG: DUF3810 domain-containing protein [Clostridium sp.]|nr:DUF3810 domain-containing protein [Clostridium sp.]